jgi:hypothetical protein
MVPCAFLSDREPIARRSAATRNPDNQQRSGAVVQMPGLVPEYVPHEVELGGRSLLLRAARRREQEVDE